jgi:hypothetical protein
MNVLNLFVVYYSTFDIRKRDIDRNALDANNIVLKEIKQFLSPI